jgi:hypothetical protein
MWKTTNSFTVYESVIWMAQNEKMQVNFTLDDTFCHICVSLNKVPFKRFRQSWQKSLLFHRKRKNSTFFWRKFSKIVWIADENSSVKLNSFSYDFGYFSFLWKSWLYDTYTSQVDWTSIAKSFKAYRELYFGRHQHSRNPIPTKSIFTFFGFCWFIQIYVIFKANQIRRQIMSFTFFFNFHR